MNIFFSPISKISYNNHECASYMAARLPANYAVLSRVMNEVRISAMMVISFFEIFFLTQTDSQ